jgi:feruloyl-CoA synthase
MKMRELALGNRSPRVNVLPDGATIIESGEALKPFSRSYTEKLVHWAETDPDRCFLAQRTEDGKRWRRISYGEAYAKVRCIAQGLLDRGLSQERTVAILSENEIEHALLALAAMHVGIAYAPISVNYSLVPEAITKLRHCINLLTPGLVYVSDADAYRGAIEEIAAHDAEIVYRRGTVHGGKATLFEELAATVPTAAVDEAARAIRPEMIARILFTSGSTGMPKGVINTHQSSCANMQMTEQVWPFIKDQPPVLCDWLPWNHTFGSGIIFGLILQGGGTMYIDDGRPLPELFHKTVRNLNDVRPTLFMAVPASFEMLLPSLNDDAAFRENFFSRLILLYYSGAGLAEPINDRFRRMAAETARERIFTTTAYGATETGPLAVMCHWDTRRMGVVGLPVPGVQLKLIPNGGKLEARLKGTAISVGYFRQPHLTAAVFDEEGWYRTGDALRYVDPDNIEEGLIFDGRIAEDFKLTTGTWVNVGPLKILATDAFDLVAKQILICGHDRAEVGILVFPDIDTCRQVAGLSDEASLAEILASPKLIADLQQRLDKAAAGGTSSSNRIARLRIVERPLDPDELTEKKTLCTNIVLSRRAAEIADMYADEPSARVLRAARRQSAVRALA